MTTKINGSEWEDREIINALILGWQAKKNVEQHTSFELLGVKFGAGEGPCRECITYAAKILQGWDHHDAKRFLCQPFQNWLEDIVTAEEAIQAWQKDNLTLKNGGHKQTKEDRLLKRALREEMQS